MLICADCLNERVVESIATKCSLLFLPISLTDPAHPVVEGHPVSERIAKKYGVIVAKLGVSPVDGGVKSVVISPGGVVKEAKSYGEELLIVDLKVDGGWRGMLSERDIFNKRD